MRIYYNRVPVDTLERFHLRQNNSYFVRLVGVNLFFDGDEHIQVEGVYQPLIGLHRYPGQVLIEIPWKDQWAVLLLQRARPWATLALSGTVMSDDES